MTAKNLAAVQRAYWSQEACCVIVRRALEKALERDKQPP
jgi:hypothetical protein